MREPKKGDFLTYLEAHKQNKTNGQVKYFEDVHYEWRQLKCNKTDKRTK